MIPNPEQNQLSEKALKGYLNEAVRRSGYPLQSVVAKELQKTFGITEEWGYTDRTTQEQRTLDIFAYKELKEENQSGTLVSPSLVLLVECKKSEHPFVFFKSETELGRPLSGFPRVCGVPRVELRQTNASREITPTECLGLELEAFAIEGPPICTSLAKAGGRSEQQGGTPQPGQKPAAQGSGGPTAKGIALTGSDAYQSILMPLASSLDFLGGYYTPSEIRLAPTFALAVCVVDGPMVLSVGGPEEPELSMVPWVRLLRREKQKIPNSYRHIHYVVDFVHRYAVSDFVAEALSFAELARTRFNEQAPVFKQGYGVVTDLNDWTWSDIQVSR